MKINTLKAFSELEFERQKFDVSVEQADTANEIAFQKLMMMEDPIITGARIDGYIELKDPTKPATPDNLQPTQKFKDSNKSMLDILKKQTKTTKLTQSQASEVKYGKAPQFGITYIGDKSKIKDELREIVGQRVNNLAQSGSAYNDALKKEGGFGASTALSQVISAFDGINSPSVKIDYNKLDPTIRREIEKKEGEAFEIFRDNLRKFINPPNLGS